MQNNVQKIILLLCIVISVHRLAPEGYIKKQQTWLHMGIKMRKCLNLYHTQMLPRAQKINKIKQRKKEKKKEHKINSLCTINSTW